MMFTTNALLGQGLFGPSATGSFGFADLDASLALARAAARALMALSLETAETMQAMALEEVDRLSMDCTEESVGTIAIIRDAVSA
jgi:hypothetical protein